MASNITIAKLNTLVTANATQFMGELTKAHHHASEIGEGIKKSLELFGIGLSAAGVIEFGKSIFEMGKKVTDLSIETGMSAESFETLAAKAAQSGLEMEQVAKGTENLRNKLQEAASGSQVIRDELAKLHLTFAGLQALKPEEQWEAIGRAVEESKNKQEAYNIVSDLFGAKIGPKLKEVLEALAGKEGFKGLNDEMANMRLSNDQIKSLRDAGIAFDELWLKMKVFGSKQALDIGSFFKSGANGFERFAEAVKGKDGETLAAGWRRVFGGGGEDAGKAFNAGDGTSKAGANGTTLHFGLEKVANELGKKMAEGARAYAEAHPWDSIKVENAQDAKVKAMLGEFFGPIDEKEKAAHSGVIQTSFPTGPNDRNTRIGLLSDGSKTMADENKKQTDLLKGVVSELKDLNRKAFGAGTTYQ